MIELANKSKLLLKWFEKERNTVYRIYFLAILQGALYIAIPLSIQGIVTYTMAGKFTASLFLLSTITIVATALIGMFQLWQLRINETLQQRIFAGITDRLANYMAMSNSPENVKKKMAYFFETVTLQKGIGKILLELSFSAISIVFGLLLLPAYSNWFLIFTIILSVAFYLTVSYYGKKAQDANIQTSNKKYSVFDKLFNSSEKGSASIDEELGFYINYRKAYFSILEKQYVGILIFKVMFVSVLLILGAYLVHIGEINIGQFVASEIIILLVINSVEKMVLNLGTFYDITTSLVKLEEIFRDKPEYSYLQSEDTNFLGSVKDIYNYHFTRMRKVLITSILVSVIVILILPWTQTVNLTGQVSVINPEMKQQQITSRIAGLIERWYIRDGDMVKKNDTIAFISEIKEEYMDSLLVQRSESQVKSKETAMRSYEGKINAIDDQIDALNRGLRLKTEQVRNKLLQVQAKLTSDSMEAIAANNNLKVAEEQYKRFEELLTKGIISKTEYENRKVKVQDALAKKITSDNKVIGTRNELVNTEIELNSVKQEYMEKLMKSEAEKFSTISILYEAEGSLTKLQNQLSNYSLRNSYYYVLAPQDGYVNNLVIKGVGEIIKEGGVLCNIVPLSTEQAVELYIDPIDLPLISNGETVRLIFDGYPSFVFTGWPGVSFGTFSAKVVSFDKVISPNGKFRILAFNSTGDWPKSVQIGGGVKGFALLKDVPLIYELWRLANGFPPEFYQAKKVANEGAKK